MIELIHVADNISRLIITGSVDALDFIDFGQLHGAEYRAGVLLDVSHGDLSKLDAQQMRDIADFACSKSTHTKTALYCPDDLNYGISRMYEGIASARTAKSEIRIFREESEALAWLAQSVI